MPKAKKEFVLNYATNRWQLNFKRNVGPTSDSIRCCSPTTCDEWKTYYYRKVRTHCHICDLGKRLYLHIKNDLPKEERFHPSLIASITEQDCISYMEKLVIDRVYEGYMKEHGR